MKFLEKDLESIVMGMTSDQLHLVGLEGISYSQKKANQVRIGHYGICDILTVEKSYIDDNPIKSELIFTIVELKKGEISMSGYIQLCRYMAGLRSYLENYRNVSFQYKIKGILIGNELDLSKDFCYVNDYLHKDILFYQYSYEWDGIRFESLEDTNLVLRDEGFKGKDI